MATEIYKQKYIKLFDGTEIQISPLKIKYLRELMDTFQNIYKTKTDDEALEVLVECTRICMKQYYPKISRSISETEDAIDLSMIHEILDIAAGIKLKSDNDTGIKENAESSKSGQTWEDLDLVKLEVEVFMLGKWKNFEELEESLCMMELTEILGTKRDLDYEEKKFMAAIQGVDLEENSDRGQKEWEDMKARVFSGGKATDSNDVLALQGETARQLGFGIGYGLDYSDERDQKLIKQ